MMEHVIDVFNAKFGFERFQGVDMTAKRSYTGSVE